MQLLSERVRDVLLRRIESRTARVGVVGLGYVGLPLAVAFARAGFSTVGIDSDSKKVLQLRDGASYIGDISDSELAAQEVAGALSVDTDTAILGTCDVIAVCVPTPLGQTDEPDLSYIERATRTVATYLRPGQLIVLESTTYPGCTEELVLEALTATGLVLDSDFLLAFSPERVDPGNTRFKTADVPRIVGGCSAASADAAAALYRTIVPSVHVTSSARVAETAKLLENTFRAVNIALVNELSLMCYQMDIDIWEVIEAAKTKPYGFMPFYPGPGIGGHCIPLDPAYFTWRGRQFGVTSRIISVAEQINSAMPNYVVQRVGEELNECGKPLNGARVLVLGTSYKKNVGDLRESPAIEIIQGLRAKRARVSYYDPFIEHIDFSRLHAKRRRQVSFGANRRASKNGAINPRRVGDPLESVALTPETLRESDCVLIVTDHDAVDYAAVAQNAALVLDTRHVIPNELRARCRAKVVSP